MYFFFVTAKPKVRASHKEYSMSKAWFITGTNSGIGLNATNVALKIGNRVVGAGKNVQKLRSALGRVVIVALLAGSGAAYAIQETPIQVAMDDGNPTTRFTLGNQRCMLVDEAIRCMRAVVDLDSKETEPPIRRRNPASFSSTNQRKFK